MEVQCFEMWGKVKLEKLQNDPSLVSHSILFVLMKEFPNFSFVVMHSNMNINMDSNKRVHCKQTNNEQTNKQTNKDVWAFKKRTLNHLISHNVHHINHNKGIKMKWQGLDLHRFSCLLSQPYRDLWFHQCSSFSMTWPGLSIGWTNQVPAPPPGTASSCCWWVNDQLRTKDITPHKRTCSLSTLHDHCMVFILQLFNWDLIPCFEILPFPWWNIHNK